MKRQSLGTHIWDGFRRIHGPATSGLGILLGFISFKYAVETKVELIWLIFLAFISYLALCTFISVAVDLWKEASASMPKVKSVRLEATLGQPKVEVFMVEPSSQIAMDSLVSIFYRREDGFEIRIGIGSVINVQANSLIQIAAIFKEPAQEDLFAQLLRGNVKDLERVLIKPSIPRAELDRFSETREME